MDFLVEIDPDKYLPCVCNANKSKILHEKMKKPLCGMLMASMLCCKQLKSDIKKTGYKINPCDMRVANKKINGSQHTLTWHADDAKASHKDLRVNDKFYEWCNKKHGSEELGYPKVSR